MENLAYAPTEALATKDLEKLAVYDDVITEFSEIVDGVMKTSFELCFNGKELYGRDGRAMGEVTQKSLDEAIELVKDNSKLTYELRRRRLEREEYEIALQMARGEAPNTMIITSDFPPELMDADEDVGGYNVARKQTMLRVLMLTPDGNIQMHSQSLDLSDRQALEAIHAYFDRAVQPGELLGQRRQEELSAADQANLTDRLTGIYDRVLAAKYGGQWYAGRQPADYRNTFDFVSSQTDLVARCVELKMNGQITENAMYDLAAAMQKRFERINQNQNVVDIMPRLVTVNSHSLDREILLAGQQARSEDKSFDACGVTYRPDNGEGDLSLTDRLDQAGYGNRANKVKTPRAIRCIKCGKMSPKEKVISKDSWHCPHCEYRVDICSGKILHHSQPKVSQPPKVAEVISLENYRRQKQASL